MKDQDWQPSAEVEKVIPIDAIVSVNNDYKCQTFGDGEDRTAFAEDYKCKANHR